MLDCQDVAAVNSRLMEVVSHLCSLLTAPRPPPSTPLNLNEAQDPPPPPRLATTLMLTLFLSVSGRVVLGL